MQKIGKEMSPQNKDKQQQKKGVGGGEEIKTQQEICKDRVNSIKGPSATRDKNHHKRVNSNLCLDAISFNK